MGKRTKRILNDRSGFSLVEMLVVVAIVGIVSGIARPQLQRAVVRARAAEAIAQLDVIEVAVHNYYADNNAWPEDKNRGIVPPGLDAYLPDGFSFVRERYTIDYDNWSTQTPGFIGLTVISSDAEVGEAMIDLIGGKTWSDGMTKFTWVVEWM